MQWGCRRAPDQPLRDEEQADRHRGELTERAERGQRRADRDQRDTGPEEHARHDLHLYIIECDARESKPAGALGLGAGGPDPYQRSHA